MFFSFNTFYTLIFGHFPLMQSMAILFILEYFSLYKCHPL